MKKAVWIICFLSVAIGSLCAKTVTGYFTFDKIESQGSFRFTQKSIPVTVTLNETAGTLSITNMFGYSEYTLVGQCAEAADGKSYDVTFERAQKAARNPSGQDVYVLYYATYGDYKNYVDKDKNLTATLGKDGKTLKFNNDLGLFNPNFSSSEATVFFGGCSVTFSSNIFAGTDDIDIFLDNKETGVVKYKDSYGRDKEKVVAVQKAFFGGSGYDEALKPVEPVSLEGYVINPCLSGTGSTFSGLTVGQKAAMTAAGYATSGFENSEWRAVGYEVSLNTTDDFQSELATWVGLEGAKVEVTRTAYSEMTDKGNIVDKWIVPNPTMQMGYELYDERMIIYKEYGEAVSTHVPCGVHFKDVIPVHASQQSPYYVDYVVYWYGKVKEEMVASIPAAFADRNTSFVKVNGEWYYYAVPDGEFRYVSAERTNYAETSTMPELNGELPVGYHLRAEFDLGKLPTGVDGVAAVKHVTAVSYCNLQGVESRTPWPGINLVHTTYSDGSVAVAKRIIK